MTARTFDQIAKDAPTASAVHADTALGNEKRKAKTFYDLRVAEGLKSQVAKRDLQPHDADTAKSPFLYDPNALATLRPDQIPRFFGALTDSEKLPEADIPLDGLVAMQDRVDPKKVGAIRSSNILPAKLPVVVVHNGKNYIADGHHRLTAQWLNGDETAKVRVKDLTEVTTALKRWSLPIAVKKTSDEKQMVFGWASVVTKGGKMIVDKQGHAIPPEELEQAAYNFVLNYRAHGDMHENVGTGRLVESMVFTLEKQQALGIDLGMEAWWTGFKVDDAEAWASHKRGERPEFSIGGSGHLIPAGATEA